MCVFIVSLVFFLELSVNQARFTSSKIPNLEHYNDANNLPFVPKDAPRPPPPMPPYPNNTRFRSACDDAVKTWRDEFRQAGIAITFGGQFTNDMVLQRAPHKSAIYGAVMPATNNSKTPPTVKVTLKNSMASKDYSAKVSLVAIPNGKTMKYEWDWKVIFDPMNAGGLYTITATCESGCDAATKTVSIENVLFGDVFFCSGQSNMVLQMYYTFSRNISYTNIARGAYANIRYFTTYELSLSNPISVLPPRSNAMWYRPSKATLDKFSAACWYFGQSLTEYIDDNQTPIGLIVSAVGGTMIEAWTANHTISSQCSGSICPGPGCGGLFNGMLTPFVNMTIKGVVWYQGENNIYELNGFSSWMNKTGYGCMEPLMVRQWRKIWSAEPGTTDPVFPFGVTSIAAGGDEGHPHIEYFRLAQTANYGILPNPEMPNTFIAQTYDLQDPWAKKCYYLTPPTCRGTARWSWDKTHYFMGPIHPRDKLPVGERLAVAASAIIYGKKNTWTGPKFMGCRLNEQKKEITLQVDTNLLNGENVTITNFQPLNESVKVYDASAMKIQLDGEVNWRKVNVTVGEMNQVVIDISLFLAMNKTIVGVAYGWGQVFCCGSLDMSRNPCPPASCNIKSSLTNLPAVPFLATIVQGKCVCPAPIKCV